MVTRLIGLDIGLAELSGITSSWQYTQISTRCQPCLVQLNGRNAFSDDCL